MYYSAIYIKTRKDIKIKTLAQLELIQPDYSRENGKLMLDINVLFKPSCSNKSIIKIIKTGIKGNNIHLH